MVTDEKDKKISLLLEDLNSLESYISALFTFSPLPLCFVSPAGVILESNPAFEKISNFSFDEIVGKTIDELFDRKEIRELVKDTLKKGSVEGREMKFFPKGKKQIPAQVFSKKKKDEKGKTVGYFLSLFDLTEIKKTERKLEEAKATLEVKVKARTKKIRELAENLEEKVKERTKSLIESRESLENILEDVEEERRKAVEEKNKTLAIITNFADGLLVFDKEDKLALINPKAKDFFALKTKKIIGKTASDLLGIPIFKQLIALYKKEVFREKLKIKEELVLEITAVPLMSEKKRLGTVVILHDITREGLIERMKSEFVSLAAHQLRTPLSTIKWILRMVLDGELGALNKEQKDFLGDGYKSNERMIALINDLLDVTRIEEGRYIYNLTLIDIEELILEIINSYQKEIRKKGLYVEFKKPAKKPPKIMADVEKIKIAIDNIFDNAVRYSLAGGKVTVFLKYDKKEIELQVKDTGLGISKNQQKRIFTKFFRGINAVKKETEGTGLGLFIAKNIIEAHKGKIWFKSKEGEGTTFYFILPIR